MSEKLLRSFPRVPLKLLVSGPVDRRPLDRASGRRAMQRQRCKDHHRGRDHQTPSASRSYVCGPLRRLRCNFGDLPQIKLRTEETSRAAVAFRWSPQPGAPQRLTGCPPGRSRELGPAAIVGKRLAPRSYRCGESIETSAASSLKTSREVPLICA